MKASHFFFLGDNRTLRRHTSPQKRVELSQAYRHHHNAKMRVRRPKTRRSVDTQEVVYTPPTRNTRYKPHRRP